LYFIFLPCNFLSNTKSETNPLMFVECQENYKVMCNVVSLQRNTACENISLHIEKMNISPITVIMDLLTSWTITVNTKCQPGFKFIKETKNKFDLVHFTRGNKTV
jgi:hypothetical protein